MEELPQQASKDHRKIYYLVQLKVIDITQSLRTTGLRLTENQIKSMTSETLNHFNMLQNIFAEANVSHIYDLIKHLSTNLASIITIILGWNQSDKQSRGSKYIPKQTERNSLYNNLPPVDQSLALKGIKKRKMGGVHMYNENHDRYLEDHRILQQIQKQKRERIHKRKMQILGESILEQLNHKTDVEQNIPKNDEITNYIIQCKDKNSIFNYISYESELQQIMEFFKNSQNQANEFLLKKGGIKRDDTKFSFADFQRQVQAKNSSYKKIILQKLRLFLEKYRMKEKYIEIYVQKKQKQFKKLQQKYMKGIDKFVQTDFMFEQFMKNNEKQIEMNSLTLESIKKAEIGHLEAENHLINDVAVKGGIISKLTSQIQEMELKIECLKKIIREEKQKKANPIQRTKFKFQSQLEIQYKQNNSLSVHKIPSQKILKKASNINYIKRMQSYQSAVNNQEVEPISEKTKSKKKFIKYNLHQAPQQERLKQTTNSVKNILEYYQTSVQTERKFEHLEISTDKNISAGTPLINDLSNMQLNIEKQVYKPIYNQNKKTSSSPMTPKGSAKKIDKIYNKKKQSQKQIGEHKKQSTKKIKFTDDQPLNLNKMVSTRNFGKDQNEIPKLDFKQEIQQDQSVNIQSLKYLQKEPVIQRKSADMTDQTIYKIFQVIQESEQQKDYKKQRQNMTYEHLYSLTINLTYKKENQVQLNLIPQVNQISNTLKNQREPTEPDSSTFFQQKQSKRVSKFFDSLSKVPGLKSQSKKQQIKKWKKKIITNLKSKIMSEQELQQIIKVVNRPNQQPSKQQSSFQQSPINSSEYRNSLPQIKELGYSIQKMTSVRKLTTQHEQYYKQIHKSTIKNIRAQAEIEKKIDDMIHFESFKSYFPIEFHKIHKKCKQGPICSHITKYFDTIMRYFEERKQKQKLPIALHVQNIGRTNQTSLSTSKQTKDIKKSNEQSSNKRPFNRKDRSMNQRKSMDFNLPALKDPKASVHQLKNY